jgi:hypothetical protein
MCHHSFVFLGVVGAGGVKQHAPRFETVKASQKKLLLEMGNISFDPGGKEERGSLA